MAASVLLVRRRRRSPAPRRAALVAALFVVAAAAAIALLVVDGPTLALAKASSKGSKGAKTGKKKKGKKKKKVAGDVAADGGVDLDELFGDEVDGGDGVAARAAAAAAEAVEAEDDGVDEVGVDGDGGGVGSDASKKLSTTTQVFELEHSLGGPFVPRGTLELRVNQLTGKTAGKFVGGGHGLSTADDAAAFRQLMADDGFYRVRTRSQPLNAASSFTMTSIRACVLARLRFEERILLHVDGSGALQAMDYVTPAGVGGRECREKDADAVTAPVVFKSAAKVVAPQEVPGIPASAIGGLSIPTSAPGATPQPATTAQPADGDKKPDERGFFSRYMWIIIPVVAIMALSGGGAEPGQRGGGGGGGSGGGGGGR
uniref:ER membrane protein complex subunit 10 n=1 Tax=Bicosoecida sp. CB-2014 TaxID=1486930 RepID=A0A7S1GAW3_9STRA